MSNWKAGDKGVFLGHNGAPNFYVPHAHYQDLVRGTVYLVSGVYNDALTGELLLSLAPDIPYNHCGWHARNFRKLVTASERISQEQEGLIPHEGFWELRPDL